MTYDEELTDRVRVVVNGLDGIGRVDEKQMFGGLAFLVHGHMALAASSRGGIMVRVAADDREELLAQEHVEVVEMHGRETRGWLRVDAAGLTDDTVLKAWAERGVAVVRTL